MNGRPNSTDFIAELNALIESRVGQSTADSYVAGLMAAGEDAILRKVNEEAGELILAVKAANKEQVLHETADLWFHTMVMLVHQGLSAGSVIEILQQRFGKSGLAEKALRSSTDSS